MHYYSRTIAVSLDRSNTSRDYIEITDIRKTRRTTYIYPKSDRAENYTDIT